MVGVTVDVTICNLRSVAKMVNEWTPDVVVSAVPIGIDGAPPFKHVDVPIDDIYNRELLLYKNAIRAVLAVKGERILVHCEHGQSRSAALAIAKIYQDNPDNVEVFLTEHPEAEPNPLLLLLADEILSANGDLFARCRFRYKGRQL